MAQFDWLVLRTRRSVLNFVVTTAAMHLLAGCLQILFLGVMVARLNFNRDILSAPQLEALEDPGLGMLLQLLAPAIFSVIISLLYQPLKADKVWPVFGLVLMACANAALALKAYSPVPEWHALQILLSVQSILLLWKLSTLPTTRKASSR